MHVVLISACEKRAIKRTRAVLDSYAMRAGERTWVTPITQEGMQELRGMLRRTATRQTAVACYRNEGYNRLKLLWVVGSRSAFGPNGHYPAGTRQVKRRLLPRWVRFACLLAQAGGLGHDLGKASNVFAGKLAQAVAGNKPERDPVRHEWVSLRLLQIVRDNRSLDAAWSAIRKPKPLKGFSESGKPWQLKQGIRSAWDALDFLVVTHHRLLGPADAANGCPNHTAHIVDERFNELQSAGDIDERILQALNKCMDRLQTAGERSPEFWRGLALIARAALILADHTVSAREWHADSRSTDTLVLYANTIRDGDWNVRYNQPLHWHLEQVSRTAASMAYRLATLRLPALSQEAIESIMSPADEHGRFAWQNRAVACLHQLRETSPDVQALVFNIAATGSGKTLMNAKAACALNTRPRFAVALNLRALTLQTGDALRRDTGIGVDELATVIGDRTTATLHEWGRTTFDVDAEESVDYDALGGEVELPAWMNSLADKRPAWRRIIGAPVLVSTIDFLINAGEPGAQGNHVGALLRLADSDLILDEIDSYDPEALVAVLRLVQAAALMGRHVVCSSATLATPVAEAVHEAFASGVRMRDALEERPNSGGKVVIVDDRITPEVDHFGEGFRAFYEKHARDMMACVPSIHRRPVLQAVEQRDEDCWCNAVLKAVDRLHGAHRWSVGATGQTISFGLVRVANIRTAIPLARYLAEQLPHARIACYHSQEFVIQRYLKEKRLDALLSRKGDDRHIEQDAEIRALLAQTEASSISFIVVATPVEEIGRDHDFDWAVIEPSSTQSIVQTAGRVNRHRLQPVATPNVAILQFNARWARGKNTVFCRPGLESDREHRYSSHDLGELLDWSTLESVDARLRFGEHRFAKEDDRILKDRLKEPVAIIDATTMYPSSWMTTGFYNRYRLRSGERNQRWRMVVQDDKEVFEREDVANYRTVWNRRNLDEIRSPVDNDWLAFPLTTLVEACEQAGIDVTDGLMFSVPESPKSGKLLYDRSFGFLKM